MTAEPDGAVPRPDGQGRRASDVYRARMVAVDNGRVFAALANLIDLTISPFYPDTWTEPRFHVLVGREGVDAEVGVRTARTKRRARHALADVEHFLATSTVAEARAALDLDF